MDSFTCTPDSLSQEQDVNAHTCHGHKLQLSAGLCVKDTVSS